MLETPGEEALRTWQLAGWPLAPGESCAATPLGPHRRAYLTFEGEVSHGRGTVSRVDEGDWRAEGAAIVLREAVRLEIAAGMARRLS